MQENPMLTMIREVCALGRAEFARPHTPDGDDAAQRELVRGMTADDPDGQPSDIKLSLDLLAPRAPYFDQGVLDAIATGHRQIVNVGAGYDDRALRFRHPEVTYFELDLPHIINDKQRRLAAMGADTSKLSLIPADLHTDNAADLLAGAHHDASRPSLFLGEHLLLFLDPDDVARLLDALSRRAAPGSTLAITAEVHPAGLDSPHVVDTVDEVMFGGAGPLRTIKSRDAWLTLLQGTGWKVDNTDEVTAVNHFELPVDGQPMLIQTQFLTATAQPRHTAG
ncbi:hypothetical protein Ate02nite_49580 [Paractinoplanes tereljensis]|uniref:S-adenosyl-L-methionine-dependent methyltransferase n=2 Tax=Paractinoplanes tereljensis TaxID=571912 RepID=A0A919NQ16_9ACTN|nr:hypothetical protein Ate02nite_49580 [Actinoplanes tereljensis]